MLTRAERDQWTAALRSGRYAECRGHYIASVPDPEGRTRCCAVGVGALTVICGHDLATAKTVPAVPYFFERVGFDARRVEALFEWERYSFADVADWIDAYLPVCDPIPDAETRITVSAPDLPLWWVRLAA